MAIVAVYCMSVSDRAELCVHKLCSLGEFQFVLKRVLFNIQILYVLLADLGGWGERETESQRWCWWPRESWRERQR